MNDNDSALFARAVGDLEKPVVDAATLLVDNIVAR